MQRSASSLFDDVRQASFELWRHDRRWDSMERRTLALGGMGGSTVSAGSISDRTRSSDALMDYESAMERKVSEWCDLVDYGASILYGTDWQHGIASGLGLPYAEILECIYIQRMSLRDTARRTKFSKSTVQRMRRRAFNYIDAIGTEKAIAGD